MQMFLVGIYALPEFKEYHEQLAVNDFVRVGITDTNYIKLRVIEITYNPCKPYS